MLSLMSEKTSRVWWFVYALLVAANAFDAISTHIVVAEGQSLEVNPLMNYVITSWGWGWFFTVKVLIVVPLAFLVPHISSSGKLMLTGAVLLYLFLTMWHIFGRFILLSTL